ncbi:hypothetical protein L7F22_047785 [Adiantum nelumboides]|nr:hypothetical protein [Adiantum nelumboides]
MAFPNFHGRRGENAGNFLDDLEMAFLVSGREDEEIKLRAFPLVLREEAKVSFQDLDMDKQGNWEALKRAFLLRYSGDNNPEEIWRKLSKLQQASPDSYSELKDRKLQFQRSWRDHSQAASRVTTLEQVHPSSPNRSRDPYLDRLRRVTKQLDSLSINLIHGLQPEQPVQQQAGGRGPNDEVPRRPPRREYQCHNYGENEHGMYFCPYPKGYGNAPPRGPQQQVSPPRMRPPPMPMCEQQQQPQQHQTIQILRQSIYASVPQPTTEVPPLPHDGVERAMNVISCEDKGEEKIMEAEAMPGKQATVAKEPRQMTTNDGANKKEKKRKKKSNMTRRKIGIINFLVPHNLIEEVQRQEHKLTWPQLLHLSPRMRRQWSKIVSTRRSKSVNTLKAQVLENDVLVLDTQIKGQRVSSDYVDGGAQVCVISEKMMHKLRLEVSGPSGFKGNDVSVKYVGVVTVCGIQFGVDMYVLPARGEGYPIILGRPWLIAMNARQDWESRTLLLKPPRKEGTSIQTIVYNVKEGRKESSELETPEDEWSTEDSSSTTEVTSSVNDSESEKSSLLEAMGVVLTRSTTQDGGSIKETLSDEKIEDMLSTDLSKEERKEFEVMLQKHSPLFILDYKQIKGVLVIGGSRLSQTLGLLTRLLKTCSSIVITGSMVFTFYKALGYRCFSTPTENALVPDAVNFLSLAAAQNVDILLPVDLLCIKEGFAHTTFSPDNVPEGWIPVSVGQSTLGRIENALLVSKMALWIGPLSLSNKAEDNNVSGSLAKMFSRISRGDCITIVGGRQATSAIKTEGDSGLISHISRGGASFMEFLKGLNLPAVSALDFACPGNLEWEKIYSYPSLPLVIDVGCGNGLFILRMARNSVGFLNFLGLEVRKKLVDQCLTSVTDNQAHNVHFAEADAGTMFKRIVCSYPGKVILVAIQCPVPNFNNTESRRRMVQKLLVEQILHTISTDGKIFLQSDVKSVAMQLRQDFLEYGKSRIRLSNEHHDAAKCDAEGWLLTNPLGVSSDWEDHVLQRGDRMYRVLLSCFSNSH